MVFKLVRVDSVEPCKINLPVGKHVIGRGNFLNVENINDKRVSRNHAEIEVIEDMVNLKSLHQNPCFFIKKNTEDTQILKLNDTTSLCNGDKFGILPQTYWYEVIRCTLDDALDIGPEKLRNDLDVNSESTDIAGDDKCDDVTNCDFNDSFQNNERPEMPESPSVSAPIESPSATNQSITQGYEAEPGQPSVPSDQTTNTVKRLHSEDDTGDGNKKVKTEPEDPEVKQMPPDALIKDEPVEATAGPSSDQGSTSKDDGKDSNKPASPVKPAPPRERCMYGANCYRRNPQHKAQFSHPSDSDWGAGERGVCPYGRDCRRRHPRHWLNNQHPPGVEPPPNAPPPGMQVVERHGNIFYINANSVNFYDDHFRVEDSDGDSVDYDYEF